MEPFTGKMHGACVPKKCCQCERKLRSGHALSALLVNVREKCCHLTSPAVGCGVLLYFGPQLGLPLLSCSLSSAPSSTAAKDQPLCSSQLLIGFCLDTVLFFVINTLLNYDTLRHHKIIGLLSQFKERKPHLVYKSTDGQFKMNLQKRIFFF